MVIIIGKSASGKDAVVKEMTTKHNFKKLVTYTTRPKRRGEKEGVTYHFTTEKDFLEKVSGNFFAEWKSYETEFGRWYYGSSIEDINNATDDTIIILTPEGYRDVVKTIKNDIKVIYLYANNSTIKERLKKRGDDKNEAQRRIEHDNADFKGLENEVDKIFYNNKDTNLKELVKEIVSWTKKEK